MFETSTDGDLSSRRLLPETDPLPTELDGDSRSLIARSPSGVVGARPGGGGSPRGPNGDGNPKGNEAAAAAASDPGANPGYRSAILIGNPVSSLILG